MERSHYDPVTDPHDPLTRQDDASAPAPSPCPRTQKAYVRAVADLARFYWRSPDQLTTDEIRDYLHHLLVERHLAWSTCNIVAAGLRFFYLETLRWDALQLNLPPRKGQRRLPRVLSVDELKRLLASTTSL